MSYNRKKETKLQKKFEIEKKKKPKSHGWTVVTLEPATPSPV